MERITFESPNGAVAGFVWSHPEPRAVLHVVHGMAEHGRRYARFADAAVDRGFAVYAHDHRGHGETSATGTLGHMGDDDAWNRAVFDVHRVARAIRQRHPGLPLGQLAHSMGSFMAQQQLWEFPGDYDAVALSGSNGRPPAVATIGRGLARVERRRHGVRGVSPLLQRMSFDGFNKGFEGRTEFDWLSRDAAEVDAYVADRFCGFPLTVQSWIDLLDAMPKWLTASNLARVREGLPVHVVAGDQDPVGNRGKGPRQLHELYRDAGLKASLRLWPGGRHEMLNETNRAAVTADLLDFFEGALLP